MTEKQESRLRGLRALIGALVILSGAIAAPVTLAAIAGDDVCAMACCITDGHCCCKPTRPFVKGKIPEGESSFQGSIVSKPCPDGCTNSSASLKIQSRALLRSPIHDHTITNAILFVTQSPSLERLRAYRPASPRAPPSSLLRA